MALSQQAPATSIAGLVSQVGSTDGIPAASVMLCPDTGKEITTVHEVSDGLPTRDQVREIRIGPSDEVTPASIAVTSSVAECPNARDTLTDASGRFTFSDVAFGKYRLHVRREGYLSVPVTGNSSDVAIEAVAVDARQPRASITVHLIKSATVTGVVRDDRGRPVVCVRVLAASPTATNGTPGFRTLLSNRTNDRGEYRLFGLAPGDVIVVVDAGRPTRTFYPGVRDMSQAELVSIRQGEEVRLRDILMRDAPPATQGSPCPVTKKS